MDVSVLVSDPWDFGTECGVGPFRGSVVRREGMTLLIHLNVPIQYRGIELRAVVARPRYAQEILDEHLRREPVAMNLLLTLSPERCGLDMEPRDGEVTAIGSIQFHGA